ncbi:Tyrosinase [Tolypocladium paradoxum]|uniref:tyrosinase n=1 Tax=Tolypocladium paradoxum TaxID=94208 RepID=A0A2S4KWC6_9HYPO|nr:Tyrosinase [Tolypocladium paradoxum]
MLPTIANPVLVCSALSTLFALACAQAYDFGVDLSRLTRRQDATAPIVIGKLPLAANGSVPLRLEVRQMKTYPHKWDLFILALSMFQSADQNDPLSWYQIAGIHGVPFVPWNNVAPSPGASLSGYCTHSSVLFPMWHRPYLALFEQQMYKMANAIAGMFPNTTQRQLYQQAASDFRVPYWDWSRSAPAGQTHFPDVFWSPIIVQNGPNGVQNIRNPLYSYQFHPLDMDALIWNPLKQWNETKRGPELDVSLTAPPSNNERVNAALLSKLPEIQQRLYILFSNYHDFNSFSNKAWSVSQGLSTLDSIESIHDIIHIYGGSKGHMTYVPLSSFDPLFFLHHLMTDRLVAIWQILNPSAWITPMPAGETTFTAIKGSLQSSDTPLKPFYSSPDGTFWDSDTSRATEVFGYTYADTDPSLGSDDDVRQSLIQKITDWYGASSPIGLMGKAQRAGVHARPHRDAWKRQLQENRFTPNVKLTAANPSPSQILQDGHYTEWIANVHVNVEALDGSFGIHFFFGEPPADEAEWELAPNQAGSVGIFAMNRLTGSRSKISGAVPLTSALMKMVAAGAVQDLSPAAVTPFLEAALQFRVLGSDDKEVDPRLVEGLYVGITSSDVRVPEREVELPEWGPAVTRLERWV